MFSNKLDDLVNSYDKEDIILCRQTKNATSHWLLHIRGNRVAGHSEIEKKALGRNRVGGYSEIEEGATEMNRVADHFKMEERIKGVNGDMSEVSFFYHQIIKCNWKKKKKRRLQTYK